MDKGEETRLQLGEPSWVLPRNSKRSFKTQFQMRRPRIPTVGFGSCLPPGVLEGGSLPVLLFLFEVAA